MFCNKNNVNMLTAALIAFGVRDAVVCPGSRNAAIVHNLHAASTSDAAPHLRLHPVTDERSAAFVAIGLWLKTRRPVVVCVTSGSAILNLLPGVAEADFRHIPLIIISADRPAEWIGQLDGQTLPQPGALRPYADSWVLDEGATDEALVNCCQAAFNGLTRNGGRPIHFNVPLTEPLFDFSVANLPEVHISDSPTETDASPIPSELLTEMLAAQHPAVIVGQYEAGPIPALKTLKEHGWTIYAENISNQQIFNDRFVPTDFLIHIGGALVEKQLKLQLRQLPDLTVCRIDETDERPATFGHVEHKVCAHPTIALQQLADAVQAQAADAPSSNDNNEADFETSNKMPHLMDDLPIEALFVGNSTAVRWCNAHLQSHVPTYCNRGTNGIEGSLSVAAGYSLATDATVLCIIGDLSFFYDCNALWNERLRGNLRILLVNNQRGDIFYRLPGLSATPSLDEYVAASHHSTAEGIASSHRCTYLHATSECLENDIQDLLKQLLNESSETPVIMEVMTNETK